MGHHACLGFGEVRSLDGGELNPFADVVVLEATSSRRLLAARIVGWLGAETTKRIDIVVGALHCGGAIDELGDLARPRWAAPSKPPNPVDVWPTSPDAGHRQ